MKARHFIALGILGIAICGAADARSIVYDSGQWDPSASFPGSISSTGGTLNVDGFSLAVAPGGTFAVATFPAVPFITGVNNSFPPSTAYEFNWGTDASNSDSSSNGISEQVIVDVTSSTAFSVDFNYASSSCSMENATFSVGGTTYSASNPCSANQKGSNNEFNVMNGKVSGLPSSDWKSSTTSISAPEMDPNSAFSALALLLGGLAVLLGRRTSPQAASQA
jgi:hypothetical protein